MPLKVGLLILVQPDIEQAFEFYQKLGLEPKFHIKDRWAEFKLGDLKLVLCPTAETNLPDRHTGIVLEVEDLEQLHQDLMEKGIQLLSEPKTASHGIMASIKDPGNNVLDLYQPTPEKVAEIVRQAQERCCKDNSTDEAPKTCCKPEGNCKN